MSADNFDPDMTYWQSLRIVARGLIQNPIREGEWDEFKEGAKTVLYYGTAPFARLAAMILMPISAPLFTWLVQVERRKTAAAREVARQRLIDRYRPNGASISQPANQQGEK